MTRTDLCSWHECMFMSFARLFVFLLIVTNIFVYTSSYHLTYFSPYSVGDLPEGVTMGTVRELRDFLIEAELDHYYSAFKNELKIATVPQIKYLEEEDLINIGMTKPEMRRLKKFYKKECPQGKLEKFKRVSFKKIT